MRRRVTYRPSKVSSIFGTVVGVVFVCIGLFVVIPSAGAFGILWTLMAAGITVVNACQGFGGKYAGPHIEIEDDTSSTRQPSSEAGSELNAQARLEQLETLRTSGLISEEEYQAKREEILRSI